MNYLPSTTISLSANLVDLCGAFKAYLEEIDAANVLTTFAEITELDELALRVP